MPYYTTERGAPWPGQRMAPPEPSPVDLPRGVWSRPDPEYPGYVIVDMRDGDGRVVTVARCTVAYYEFRKAALAADLDAYDPMHHHLKAV